MKKFLFLIAAGSSVAFAAPAAAQDTSTFSGLRIEALGGYDTTRAGSDVDNDADEDFSDGIDGINYGVGAGFDFDAGGVVIGVEGEWMESTASTEFDTDDATGIDFANVETGRDLYLGARVGAKLGENALIYAKGGYTNASYNVLATDDTTDTETDVDLDGWRAGAGVEIALAENFFIKGEYRYSKYSEGEVEAPSGLESDRFNVDVDRHQGVVGVGMRF
jgi:outer membrane immunogenic protein